MKCWMTLQLIISDKKNIKKRKNLLFDVLKGNAANWAIMTYYQGHPGQGQLI